MNNAEKYTGQIPVFGEWENANEMPITRYFDCARQAGLLHCTCSGECPASFLAASDPYGLGFQKPWPTNPKTKGVNNLGFSHSNGPVYRPRNRAPTQKKSRKSGNLAPHESPVRAVKPVDEDLYKISPELVKNSKRGKKMLRFFSVCMAPPCAA